MPAQAGPLLLQVVAPFNATYDLQVLSGPPCTSDSACTSGGRCDPLVPNPFNLGRIDDVELTRGGVCVANDPSPCGDTSTEPNTRTGGFSIGNGVRGLFGTCLRDVDWGHFDLAASSNVDLQVSCATSDPNYQPHVMLLSAAGQVEWAALLTDARSPQNSTSNVPLLPAGTHQLRLVQMAGRDANGSCTLIVSWAPAAPGCAAAAECTAVATRFGRTRCESGACIH